VGGARATLHTPPGAGGIAAVLLAGAEARRLLRPVVAADRRGRFDALAPGRLMLTDLLDADGEILDEAILAVDCAGDGERFEIHTHGGPRIVQRLLQRLADAGAEIVRGVRAAELGRSCWTPAGQNGVDAIGAELLAALPGAQTPLVVRALTAQQSAGLSDLARRARAGEAVSADRLRAAAGGLKAMQRLLDPPEVVLAGPPNAGKSSLANRLLARPACIVTAAPGTTRDWVRELADVAGAPLWLTDTAGLWAPPDALDAEAVRRSWARVDAAAVVLAVFDAAAPPPEDEPHWRRLLAEPNVIRVANKIDAAPAAPPAVGVSAKEGAGLDALGRAILGRLGLAGFDPAAPAAFTERQARLLLEAADALDAGERSAANRAMDELLGDA
jgi:tRNA modification GTPase